MSATLSVAAADAAMQQGLSLSIVAVEEGTSFDDASVVLRDRAVLWKIVRERGVLELLVAPAYDATGWYDVDLLRRLLQRGDRVSRLTGDPSSDSWRGLLNRTVEELIGDIVQLSASAAVALVESEWPRTRARLEQLGRRRDAELFGRPLPSSD